MLHAGNATSAARHFRAAIARAPHLAEGHEALGRMLLEAGFLDIGLARLDDALAIAPSLGAARWDVARAWALLGRWDAADRVMADLVAPDLNRWVPRARLAWWRHDLDSLAAIVAVHGARPGTLPRTVSDLAGAILTGTWSTRRDAIVATAIAPTVSKRRQAFGLQLAAEVAGYFGDRATCLDLIARVTDTGAFDVPWLDSCPALASVRDAPELADARARMERRAAAILDAMYGNLGSDDGAPETVVG